MSEYHKLRSINNGLLHDIKMGPYFESSVVLRRVFHNFDRDSILLVDSVSVSGGEQILLSVATTLSFHIMVP